MDVELTSTTYAITLQRVPQNPEPGLPTAPAARAAPAPAPQPRHQMLERKRCIGCMRRRRSEMEAIAGRRLLLAAAAEAVMMVAVGRRPCMPYYVTEK